MIHAELSEIIIGAAMTVLNELKPGLDEKVYERALVIELRDRGMQVDQQKQYEVNYKGHSIGKLIPDLVVADRVVVDAKVASGINEAHVAQMIGYLAIADLELALLVNFKRAKLEWQRVVRSKEG